MRLLISSKIRSWSSARGANHSSRERVLGFEVGDGVGVVAVTEPRVLVDDFVAVDARSSPGTRLATGGFCIQPNLVASRSRDGPPVVIAALSPSTTTRAAMKTVKTAHSHPMPPSSQSTIGSPTITMSADRRHRLRQELEVARADEDAVEHERRAAERLADGDPHQQEAGQRR